MHLLALLLCSFIGPLTDEATKNPALDAVVADSASWPDDLKAKFQNLNADEQRYCVQMLGKIWPPETPEQGILCVLNGGVIVNQIVSDDAFIGKYQNSLIWIQGVNTEVLVDDSVVTTSGFVFKVDGNERYTTVIGGSKTVPKLVAVNVDDATEVIQAVLMRRGYRLFRVTQVEGAPWIIAHVSAISKTSATIRLLGERKSMRLGGDHFTEEDRAWLNDKKNLAAMKQAKKEWDAANREKPDDE